MYTSPACPRDPYTPNRPHLWKLRNFPIIPSNYEPISDIVYWLSQNFHDPISSQWMESTSWGPKLSGGHFMDPNTRWLLVLCQKHENLSYLCHFQNSLIKSQLGFFTLFVPFYQLDRKDTPAFRAVCNRWHTKKEGEHILWIITWKIAYYSFCILSKK